MPRAVLLLALLWVPGCHWLLPVGGSGTGDLRRADGEGDRGRGERALPDAARSDGLTPAACGGPALLTDSFDDGVTGPEWDSWSDPDKPVTVPFAEVGGRLVFTLAANLAGDNYSGYASTYVYNLVGGGFHVEVPVVPSDGSADAILSLTVPGVGSVSASCEPYLDAAQGTIIKKLYFQIQPTTADTWVTVAEALYDSKAHRWWKIRESGGQILWETAPDGKTWTPQAKVASPFDVGAVQVKLMAGTFDPAPANPGQVAFDNLNGGGPRSGQFCPVTSFTDSFETPERAREWGSTWTEPGCSFVETGGELVGKPPAGAVGYGAYETWTAYRLTGSAITVEVTDIVSGSAVASLQARDLKKNLILIEGSKNGLHLFKQLAGPGTPKIDVKPPIPWDPIGCRWWRLREAQGTCFWETSADGKGWQTRASESCPIDPSAVAVKLGTGAWAATPAPGEVHFDNLNLPPP